MLTLHNDSVRNEVIIGVILIVLGVLSFLSISYLFQYTLLTCAPDAERRINCTIEQFRLSGQQVTEVEDVQSVYVAAIESVGTGRFQVVRDQIVLIGVRRDVTVPYFYSANYGKMQTLETRIRNYLAAPRGTLRMRENHQVEHEFLNVIAGAALIAIGHAQIALQATRWVFDKSSGQWVITRYRVMGRNIFTDKPCAVRLERSTDKRPIRRGEKRRSWIALKLCSGQNLIVTQRYSDDNPAADQLEALTRQLRGFLQV
ncbi:MAG: hypothetical protein HC876_10330 [Chloroflexaceae bacterium]|nr:hypothetical protein [Chloroflexaceae bacterium]NJO05878.1 hypothetical protein [Chloroflexaceae bacterium]